MNTTLKRFFAMGCLILVAVLLLAGVAAAEKKGVSNTQVTGGTTTLVSMSNAGMQGNRDSYDPYISNDGRYIAFLSYATNLVPGDTNGQRDVFVHDRMTGETMLVSVSSAGVQGNGESVNASISADGRYVAFSSDASNLVTDDTNGSTDVFVHDRTTGETTLVSKSSTGVKGNNTSDYPNISDDGRYVAFESFATNLVDEDTNSKDDVFVHDRVTGKTILVSKSTNGVQGNDPSYFSSISADGRYVVFESWATNLVDVDTNNTLDVFIHNIVTGETTLISKSSTGVQGNDSSQFPSISADGRYVAFESFATNLVAGDTNNAGDVFIHNIVTGETTLVSKSSTGVQGNAWSHYPRISADSRYVAFESRATNLVDEGINSIWDVFVHNIVTGETTLVSKSTSGIQGYGGDYPSISADGRYIAFQSDATNLISGDSNNALDVFLRDTQGEAPTPTYNISGKVTDENGNGLYATINYVGGVFNEVRTVRTETGGYYTITNLITGTYTITPVLSGKTFYPANATVTVPSSKSEVNFSTKLPETLSISGRVIDHNGNGVANADVQINIANYKTDSNGYYLIPGLIAGNYTVKVTSPTMVFSPESRSVTVGPSQQNVDFTQLCVSPYTKLNVCSLEIGDVLLYRGDFDFFVNPANVIARTFVGTYWWHAALYIGNGQIAQATGKNVDPNLEIATKPVISSSFWYGGISYDWTVIRPKATTGQKLLAANYALALANQVNPPALYVNATLGDFSGFFDRESDSPTYCAKLVWKAYMQSDVDLEVNQGLFTNIPGIKDVITPDDLYFSSVWPKNLSDEVQFNPDVILDNRLVFRVFSPVDLLLTDSLGRKTGHDPRTNQTYNEIPEALYTGPDAEPETISLQAGKELTWTLQAIGTEAGKYTLETTVLTDTGILTQVVTSVTSVAKVDSYQVSNQPLNNGVLVQPTNPPTDTKKYIFLPLVRR